MKEHIGKSTLEVMSAAKWYNKWLIKFIGKYLTGDILEVGCGSGNFSNLLEKYGNVYGIDIDNIYLKNSGSGNIGYGDVEKGKYFFKKSNFESIVCFNVLEHIKNDNVALQNIYKLLGKDGNFISIVPAHDFLYSRFDKSLGHYRRYNLGEYKSKLELAGFKIKEIRYFNWWSFFGWLVFIKLAGKGTVPAAPVKIFDILGRFFIGIEKFIKPPFGLSVLAVVTK